MRSSIELPSLRDHFKQESLPPFSSRPRGLLPSILNHSPPGRSSTLPPIQRKEKLSRPRKSSITQSARKPKHDRQKSKEYGRRPSLGDRKALSAEPQTAAWAQGKRWEDLIEAATSATEVDDERHSEVCTPPCPMIHIYYGFSVILAYQLTKLGWSVSHYCPAIRQCHISALWSEEPVFITSSFPIWSSASSWIAPGFPTAFIRCLASAQITYPATI